MPKYAGSCHLVLRPEAARHRILPTVARNFGRHCTRCPSAAHRELFRSSLICNRKRNELLGVETRAVLDALDQAGHGRPRRGARQGSGGHVTRPAGPGGPASFSIARARFASPAGIRVPGKAAAGNQRPAPAFPASASMPGSAGKRPPGTPTTLRAALPGGGAGTGRLPHRVMPHGCPWPGARLRHRAVACTAAETGLRPCVRPRRGQPRPAPRRGRGRRAGSSRCPGPCPRRACRSPPGPRVPCS
jgi:hypothetical protein